MTAEAVEGSGSNVLDTPITWEMVEADIQREMGTSARIGPKRAAEACGEGNGFVSKIALVTFDWMEDTERLPARAVLKITGCERLREICEKMLNIDFEAVRKGAAKINDNEWNFYKNARSEWNLPEDIKFPKYYCGRKFGEDDIEAGYFAIEHFGDVVLRHMYHTVQPSGCVEALRMLAKLGAVSLRNPAILDAIDRNVVEEMMEQMVGVERTLTGLDGFVAQFPEKRDTVDVMRRIAPFYATVDEYRRRLDATCRIPMLCHGDMWPGNILWTRDAEGDYHVKTVIDWQILHVGSPLEDLARLLTSAIPAEEFRKRRDFYLETYFNTLKEEAGDAEIPWEDFEEFVKQFEHMFVLIIVAFCPMFVQLEEMLFKTCKAEELEECRKCFREKVFNMVDSAAEYVRKWEM